MQDIALDPSSSVEQRVRLHITPFNPQLIDRILAPTVRALASDISFHTVQTFPDRGFGYIELPTMEAQKLKQKFNGTTLRGAKVRVEEAKPESKRNVDIAGGAEDNEEAERKAKKHGRKQKKRAEEGVIPGHELEEGRRVKRGWTEKKGDFKRARRVTPGAQDGLESKSLRFKANIPPNHASVEATAVDSATPKNTKSKKTKSKVVVEEFSKCSKLRAAAAPEGETSKHTPKVYEEGAGWVDEAGGVIEAESRSQRRRSKPSPQRLEPRISAVESRETADAERQDSKDAPIQEQSMDVDTETEPATEIHPLEALFKRPAAQPSDLGKPRPKPIDTSFSFFAPADGDDDDGEQKDGGGVVSNMPPQTPHTRRDMEWRSIRSAAPTPDTAAIGRKFSFPFAGEAEEEDDADYAAAGDQDDRDVAMRDPEYNENATANANDPQRGEESAFRKWFYENRGDLNRSWKKRRRDEKKMERQRENRRLSKKIA